MTMTGPGLLPIVRSWWWLLLAGTLAGALAGFIVASTATKTYEAETQLLVGPVTGDYPTLQASGSLGRTYAELAHSRRIVNAAAQEAGVKLTRTQVQDAVSATSNDVTRLVDIQVRHQNPESAARLADAVARQLTELRQRAPAQDVDPVEAIMRDPELATLSPRNLEHVHKAALHVLGSSNAGNLEIVEAPLVPQSPVSPRVGLLVLLAALAGFLVAAAYVLIREGGLGAEDDDYDDDDFDFDTFAPATNGVGAHEDPWLDPASTPETP
jgi:capsular polysaccharide biosynthesis protein